MHLRSVCKTSASLLLEHAGLWILEYRFKSDGRCVSFVQWKGQGISNPPIQVRALYETSGYVAKRLCTGLLTRDTQVRLLSYPSFFIPTITVGFFVLTKSLMFPLRSFRHFSYCFFSNSLSPSLHDNLLKLIKNMKMIRFLFPSPAKSLG